jgi:hypothetical protein
MRLTAIQLAGLRALAEAHNPDVETWDTGDLLELGKIQGKAELARELLQEAEHRAGTVTNTDGIHRESCLCRDCQASLHGLDCDLTGAARR